MRRRANGAGRKFSEARKMMAGLRSVKKILKQPLSGFQRRRVLPGRVRPKAVEEDESKPEEKEEPAPVEPPAPIAETLNPGAEPSDLEAEAQQVWDVAPSVASTYDHLDDVPVQPRMGLRKRRPQNFCKEQSLKEFANYILMVVSEGDLKYVPAHANEWLPKAEVDKLAELLDLPLS